MPSLNSKSIVKFKMEIYAVPFPFACFIVYDLALNIPVSLVFDSFLADKKPKKCLHYADQYRNFRMFIKNVPEKVVPFTLNLKLCPSCESPVAYEFIVYEGGVDKFPEMKDIDKYKNKKRKLPTAKSNGVKKMEINKNACSK